MAASAFAQEARDDLRPLPDMRDPVGIAASAFHTWIATGTSLSRWNRIGDAPPAWYGAGRGLPSAGIASICWDSPSGTLRIQGRDGVSYVWSESFERATASDGRLSCESPISRDIAIGRLPPLAPEVDGWLYQNGRLWEPGGRHASILKAVVVDDRELWLATSNAGIWKGRWPSGRIAPLSSGLGESCIERAVKEPDGTLWLMGCSGNLARLGTDGAYQGLDPRSPRWIDLRDAIDIAPAKPRGIWVATLAGVVRVVSSGVQERFTGRKAPFGGTPVALATLEDSLWCLTSHGLAKSVRAKPFEPVISSDTLEAAVGILSLAPTRSGLLVGTHNGFRQYQGGRWVSPPELTHARSAQIRKIAVDHARGRIAWSDGTRIRVDSLSGGSGRPSAWDGAGTLHDFAWGSDGLLHIAHEAWTLWNPDDASVRTWNLPVQAELVVPDVPWSFIGGTTGGTQARTSAWSP